MIRRFLRWLDRVLFRFLVGRPKLTPEIARRAQKAIEKGRIQDELLPGWEWNPLLKYPRNNPCLCGSGEKFKFCCLHKIAKSVPHATAEVTRRHWKQILAGQVTLGRKTKQEIH